MNVIWIVSDTLRRDHVGVYGNRIIRTPSLDSLAARSIRFDLHYAAGFPTVPTRADFFTGRWTMSYMGWEPLPKDEVTLAQLLSKEAIHTAGIVDTPFYMRSEMNYDRGFHTFLEVPGQLVYRGETLDARAVWRYESDRYAPQTFIKATQWLERHREERFFLYVDTWDPHEPWDAPSHYTQLYLPDYNGEIVNPLYAHWQDIPGFAEDRVRKGHATYCGEITMVDTWVGYFLRQVENMGLMDKTAIIFTTDHGFYFGEHGGLFGKLTYAKNPEGRVYRAAEPGCSWTHSPLYEELAAIPLFIYVPGVSPGVCNGLTSNVDLMPTVLDMLEQEIPPSVEGQSLLPVVMNSSTPKREFVITAFPFTNPGSAARWADDQSRKMEKASAATITSDKWSLIYGVEPGLTELFYLPSDPKQANNVVTQNMDVARELHGMLVRFMRDTNVAKPLLEPRLSLRV